MLTIEPRGPAEAEMILGALPQRVFEPNTVEELAEIVRVTSAENLAVAPIGAGTSLSLGNAPRRYDVAIRTRGLRRVVDYVPEDQIVIVEAGITLGALQAELRAQGQRLAIDPPDGEEMTIGGVLATNLYGPSALRYGTLKDLIVGIEVVRADGVVARAGGKVVKNVAGFDLSKLMVGALGTLAIVTKATFRLHPLPEARRALAFEMPIENVFPLVLALREAQLEPCSIVARIDAADSDGRVNADDAQETRAHVEVSFEGFGPGVDVQVARCTEIAAPHPLSSRAEVLPLSSRAEVLPLSSRAEVREAHRSRGTAEISLKATFPPSEFARVVEGIKGFNMRAYVALGVLFLESEDRRGPSTTLRSARDDKEGAARDDKGTIAMILEHRKRFEALGGTLVVQRMPREWYTELDAWGTPPPAFELMQALKDRFDPQRRLNPGRFVGGL